jgi:tRNA(fMet)-specific endonuclease VapC
MDAALLDTDTLSELFKQVNPHVTARAAVYFQQFGQFSFSAFTRYEVRRGLLRTRATKALASFDQFCRTSTVLPVDELVFDRAASLWTHAYRAGHPRADADLLIAATALEHSLVLVTGNIRHFSWISGLIIEDWKMP